MIVTTNIIKFNISNNKIRDTGTIILTISKILIITVKEILTLDSKKTEIQIIQKNILTNILIKHSDISIPETLEKLKLKECRDFSDSLLETCKLISTEKF